MLILLNKLIMTYQLVKTFRPLKLTCISLYGINLRRLVLAVFKELLSAAMPAIFADDDGRCMFSLLSLS